MAPRPTRAGRFENARMGYVWATWALSGSYKDEKADDELKELCCC